VFAWIGKAVVCECDFFEDDEADYKRGYLLIYDFRIKSITAKTQRRKVNIFAS